MRVTILFLSGGMASTAVAPMEVFRSAGVVWQSLHGDRPRPVFEVTTASPDGQTACCDGVQILPDKQMKDVQETDLILVPATGLETEALLERHGAVVPWLRRWHRRGAQVAGVCTGVSLLAEAGLLDDRPATTHWAMVEEFRMRYPAVDWQPERFITDADGVYCAGGVYSSLDLSLYLVEKFAGHQIATQCAKGLLIETPRTWQSGFAIPPASPQHSDDRIKNVQIWLSEHYAEPIRLENVASNAGMSPRNFSRRFKRATGSSPLDYLQDLRINASKHMLESDYQSIQAVAHAVGYEDVLFFRRLFKRRTGVTPAAYRARFCRTAPHQTTPVAGHARC